MFALLFIALLRNLHNSTTTSFVFDADLYLHSCMTA
jgi:hypothetical protein